MLKQVTPKSRQARQILLLKIGTPLKSDPLTSDAVLQRVALVERWDPRPQSARRYSSTGAALPSGRHFELNPQFILAVCLFQVQ